MMNTVKNLHRKLLILCELRCFFISCGHQSVRSSRLVRVVSDRTCTMLLALLCVIAIETSVSAAVTPKLLHFNNDLTNTYSCESPFHRKDQVCVCVCHFQPFNSLLTVCMQSIVQAVLELMYQARRGHGLRLALVCIE